MKKITTQLIIILVGFFISFEFLSELNSSKSRLNINDKGFSYKSELAIGDVYFIGDSYASTNYVDSPYPKIFRDYFESKDLNFFDFSKAGTELNFHKNILDSISLRKPELIIYFYNISDIVSLNSDVLLLDKREIEIDNKNIKPKANFNFKDISVVLYESHTVTLVKKTLQYISLKFTGKFLRGTPAYRFPIENELHAKDIEELFDAINAKNVIILINTPFNAHPEVKNWEHYAVFQELSYKKNYILIQAVDIIQDPKYSVSWRNSHPNQEAIQIIANHIIENIDSTISFGN